MATVTTEPVAWRGFIKFSPGQSGWKFTYSEDALIDQGIDRREPLYTADALATARAEGRAEGMRKAAAWHAGEQKTYETLAKAYHAESRPDAAQSALAVAVQHKISAAHIEAAILAAIPQETKPAADDGGAG